MASDFFKFEGKIGSLHIEVWLCEQINIIGAEFHPDNAHFFAGSAPRRKEIFSVPTRQLICRYIKEGRIPMKYTGGYCPSGCCWGADYIPEHFVIKAKNLGLPH